MSMKYIKMFESFINESDTVEELDVEFIEKLNKWTVKDIIAKGQRHDEFMRHLVVFLTSANLTTNAKSIEYNTTKDYLMNVDFSTIFKAAQTPTNLGPVSGLDTDPAWKATLKMKDQTGYELDLPVFSIIKSIVSRYTGRKLGDHGALVVAITTDIQEHTTATVDPKWEQSFAILTGKDPRAQDLANALNVQISQYAPEPKKIKN